MIHLCFYYYSSDCFFLGLPRLPKWSHLKELHQAIKLCEKPLLNGEPINHSLGPSVEVTARFELFPIIQLCIPKNILQSHIFCKLSELPLSSENLQADVYTDSSGACAAFLANIDDKEDKIVEFRNRKYNLPAWSVSILLDCKNVILNTAKVISLAVNYMFLYQ